MDYTPDFSFAGSGYDRAAELRPQAAELRAAGDATTIVLWKGKVLTEGASLCRLPLSHPALGTVHETVLLGRIDGTPLFAVDLDWTPEEADLSTLGQFLDPSRQIHPLIAAPAEFAELRAIMTDLSAQDAELAATAKAVLGWHESHRFCSRCGAASEAVQGGWQRSCPSCNGQHFPRTDPVVIMLVTRGDNLLLGRSPGWPEGMYSILAGFIEPGETVEAAVRREVYEETRIRVGAVRFMATQPWPFPANLMIGCAADAETDEITVDPAELENALWISRAEMHKVLQGQHETIRPPRAGAIAGSLIRHWAAQAND